MTIVDLNAKRQPLVFFSFAFHIFVDFCFRQFLDLTKNHKITYKIYSTKLDDRRKCQEHRLDEKGGVCATRIKVWWRTGVNA